MSLHMGKCNILKVHNDNNRKLKKLSFLSSGGGCLRGDLHLIPSVKPSIPRGQWQKPEGFTLYPYRAVTRSQHPSAKR